jgi:putative peptidoglycan lipid II flippase
VILALLLHWKKLVSLGEMRWLELSKALLTGVFALSVNYFAVQFLFVDGRRRADVAAVIVTSLVWGVAVAFGLWATRSELPRALRRKPSAVSPQPSMEPELPSAYREEEKP